MTPAWDDRAESARLLGIARSAAQRCGDYLAGVFRQQMSVDLKGHRHDVVTEHDYESERLARKTILAAEPDSVIVGEEGGAQGEGRFVWHVDPIDGTVNFARGLAFWAVSVAVAVEGRLVAGVVLDPVAGLEFYADLSGAWLNGTPLRTNAALAEEDAQIVATFPAAVDLAAFGPAALEATGELLERTRAVRCVGGAALCLAHVAAGWADATFDLHTHSWDVAAGALIVRQAGGEFAGYDPDGRVTDPTRDYSAAGFWAAGRPGGYPVVDGLVSRLTSLRAAPLPA